MYYFTDPAQNKKPRYADDPKPEDLKINSKADLVAYVKQCVKDGADVIKARGDKGMNEAVNAGGPRLNRVGDLAYGLIEHSGEHYGNLWCITGSTGWCRRSRGRRSNEVKEVKDVKEAKEKRDSNEWTGAVREQRACFFICGGIQVAA